MFKKVLILFLSLLVFGPFAFSQNVTTLAGNGVSGNTDGDTSVAKFNQPFGMCIDNLGNLYIADARNNCIRKIGIDGQVSTVAGSGSGGYLDGNGTSAIFNEPTGVCVDADGNLYVAGFLNHRIRKINSSGDVTTIAGSGVAGFADGQGTNAQFNYPRGICVDKDGNLYVGDSWNHRIRKIDTSGNVTTYAGGGSVIGSGSVGDHVDGQDTSARFYTPCGVAFDSKGNLYVADAYTHRVRKIDTSGNVTTLAGYGLLGGGNGGLTDGDVDFARFNTLTELFVNNNDDVIVGDTYNNVVRLISGTTVSTIAGTETAGFMNGIGDNAKFDYTRGIAANSDGTIIYVVDHNNHSIRMIDMTITSMSSEITIDFDIQVFPNPAADILMINFPKEISENIHLKIIDSLGKEVYKEEVKVLNRTNHEINIEFLAKGNYYLIFKSEKANLNKKIVIQ